MDNGMYNAQEFMKEAADRVKGYYNLVASAHIAGCLKCLYYDANYMLLFGGLGMHQTMIYGLV
jgi:hypothetical protein